MDEPVEILPGLYQFGSPQQVDADVVICLTRRPPDYLPDSPEAEQFLSVWWPIDDGPMPDPATVRALAAFVVRVLEEGRRVLVHCLGGNNRSGLLVARCLIERGMSPHAAIERVRAAIPTALNNPEFERWLRTE